MEDFLFAIFHYFLRLQLTLVVIIIFSLHTNPLLLRIMLTLTGALSQHKAPNVLVCCSSTFSRVELSLFRSPFHLKRGPQESLGSTFKCNLFWDHNILLPEIEVKLALLVDRFGVIILCPDLGGIIKCDVSPASHSYCYLVNS